MKELDIYKLIIAIDNITQRIVVLEGSIDEIDTIRYELVTYGWKLLDDIYKDCKSNTSWKLNENLSFKQWVYNIVDYKKSNGENGYINYWQDLDEYIKNWELYGDNLCVVQNYREANCIYNKYKKEIQNIPTDVFHAERLTYEEFITKIVQKAMYKVMFES